MWVYQVKQDYQVISRFLFYQNLRILTVSPGDVASLSDFKLIRQVNHEHQLIINYYPHKLQVDLKRDALPACASSWWPLHRGLRKRGSWHWSVANFFSW